MDGRDVISWTVVHETLCVGVVYRQQSYEEWVLEFPLSPTTTSIAKVFTSSVTFT
jgi:hypothetical protein